MLEAVDSSGERVSGTQSIRRAFAILDLFREVGVGEDIGVVQISERLGFPLSTAHRITRALVAEGYLAQGEGRERYRLGVQALLLGRAAQRMMGMQAVLPVLRGLVEETQESVNLGLLTLGHVVVIQRIESPQPLRFSMEVGARVELHATSMGKSLLAFNDELREQIATSETFPQLTTKTHGTRKSLLRDLEGVRERGWSMDDEESLLGVRCVAAPIIEPAGQARAAIAVQAPAIRMSDERLYALGPVVRSAADQLARIVSL